VVKMLMLVVWVVVPSGLVGGYQCFGGTFCPEDSGNMFPRNVGIFLQVRTALQPK
jgi:hypothetical protein